MARKSYLPDLQATLDHQIARLKTYQAEQQASAEASAPSGSPSATEPPPSLVSESLPPSGQTPPVPLSPQRQRSTGGIAWLVALLGLILVGGSIVLLVAGLQGHLSPVQHPTPTSNAQNTTPIPTATTTPQAGSPTPGGTITPGVTATPGGTTGVTAPPGPTTPAWVVWGIGILLALVLTFRIDVIQQPIRWLLGRAPKDRSEAPAKLRGVPVDLLGRRISHLEMVSSWMKEDPELARLLDSSIGKQVQASEQREKVFSAVLGIGMLAAGWLLSAIAPNMLFH